MSGFGGNAIFSVANLDRGLISSVYIPFIYEHLFYKYFVRRSVRATLMDVVVLIYIKTLSFVKKLYLLQNML